MKDFLIILTLCTLFIRCTEIHKQEYDTSFSENSTNSNKKNKDIILDTAYPDKLYPTRYYPRVDLDSLKETDIRNIYLHKNTKLSNEKIQAWKSEWDSRINFLNENFPSKNGIFRNEENQPIDPQNLKLILIDKDDYIVDWLSYDILKHNQEYILIHIESFDHLFSDILRHYNLGYAWEGFEKENPMEQRIGTFKEYATRTQYYAPLLGVFLNSAYRASQNLLNNTKKPNDLCESIVYGSNNGQINLNKNLPDFIFLERKKHGKGISTNLTEFIKITTYFIEKIVETKDVYFKLKKPTKENNPFTLIKELTQELIDTKNLDLILKKRKIEYQSSFYSKPKMDTVWTSGKKNYTLVESKTEKSNPKKKIPSSINKLQVLDYSNKISLFQTTTPLDEKLITPLTNIIKEIKLELTKYFEIDNFILIKDELNAKNKEIRNLKTNLFFLKDSFYFILNNETINRLDKNEIKEIILDQILPKALNIKRSLKEIYNTHTLPDDTSMSKAIWRMNFKDVEKSYSEFCKINEGLFKNIDKNKIQTIDDLINNVDYKNFDSCLKLPDANELYFLLKNKIGSANINEFRWKKFIQYFLHFHHLSTTAKIINLISNEPKLLDQLKEKLNMLVNSSFIEITKEEFQNSMQLFFKPFTNFENKMNNFWCTDFYNPYKIIDHYYMFKDQSPFYQQNNHIPSNIKLTNSRYSYLINNKIILDKSYFHYMRSYEFANYLREENSKKHQITRKFKVSQQLIECLERFSYSGFFFSHVKGMNYNPMQLQEIYHKISQLNNITDIDSLRAEAHQKAFLLGVNLARTNKYSHHNKSNRTKIQKYLFRVLETTHIFSEEPKDLKTLTLLSDKYINGKGDKDLLRFAWNKSGWKHKLLPCLK